MKRVSGVLIEGEIPLAFTILTTDFFFSECSHWIFQVLEFQTLCLFIQLYHVSYIGQQAMIKCLMCLVDFQSRSAQLTLPKSSIKERCK